ncbi:MAG: zinc ribbon domain-containing protein [Chitinophagales bacterium]
MQKCTHCGTVNPMDARYCKSCGNPMTFAIAAKRSFFKRLPSWAWILIIVAGIALGLFLIIGGFVALATVEGVASLVLLTAGLIGFGIIPLRKPEPAVAFTRAIGISFFALMGATVDQTGNFVYNKPVEMVCCPTGTSLERQEDVSNPVPGSTYIQQDFTCWDENGSPVKSINVFAVLGIRFLEYIFLGYLLIGLRRVLWSVKNKSA